MTGELRPYYKLAPLNKTTMYRDKHGIWHCRACEYGADKITGSDGTLDSWHDSWAPNFCPNCGAKVVGE